VGKAYWCTAAHAANFKDYTKNNNKLYIIRNLKKKKFYKMDWGYRYNDENFRRVTADSLLITLMLK
jgi:hypothetical protein